MRTDPVQPGGLACAADDMADRPRRQRPTGRSQRGEHRPRLALGPSIDQPRGDRFSRPGRQRQPFNPVALADDGEFPGPPVDVVQAKTRDLASPKPESSQQQQDRVVAAVGGREPPTTRDRQKALEVCCRDRSWQRRQMPSRGRRNRTPQPDRCSTRRVCEPQERTQRSRHRLHRIRIAIPAVLDHERGDGPGVEQTD